VNIRPGLNFDLRPLAKLSEGKVLLDRQALVRSHCTAATPWVKCIESIVGALKEVLDIEVHGRVKLPVKLGLWEGAADASGAGTAAKPALNNVTATGMSYKSWRSPLIWHSCPIPNMTNYSIQSKANHDFRSNC